MVRAADAAGEPLLLLGGGSNVVIADDGVARHAVLVRSAGHAVERLPDGRCAASPSRRARTGTTSSPPPSRAGLGGLECLSGIPGRTGATPVQNVGAYGVEIADLLVDVDLYDRRTGEVRPHVPAAELGLGYRTSVLKGRADAVVLRVRFAPAARTARSAPIRYPELARALGVAAGRDRCPRRAARAAVLELRRGKGMVLDAADHDTWSVGSFFTNPIVPAADVPDVRRRCPAGPPTTTG